MNSHHTKNKGDLGEKGYTILLPQTELAPFDLVAYKSNEFKRIQVKYRELNKRGAIEIKFRSTYSSKKGAINKSADKSEIDFYYIYSPPNDQCYYLFPSLYEEPISIRVYEIKITNLKTPTKPLLF